MVAKRFLRLVRKTHKRGSQALPKTGEENSSLGMALGALATATGLAFLAKRKKDEEESEDF